MAVRKEQIGNEFVVALQIEVADVEEYDSAQRFCTFPQHRNGTLVPLEQRPEMPRDDRKLYDFTQGPLRKFRNQMWH